MRKALAVAVAVLLAVPVALAVVASASSASCPQAAAQTSSLGNARGADLAARAAHAAGFTGEDLVTAVAVAGAESDYRPTARNSIGASGLWQILQSAHRDLFAGGADWRDPAVNAAMAFRVWTDAHGWQPWTTWTGGAYRAHLPEARAAVATTAGTVAVPAALTCAGPATFTAGRAGTAPPVFDRLGNPRTVEQAITWAAQLVAAGTSIPTGLCDHYMALAYGRAMSGSGTALIHFAAIPPGLKTVTATGVPPRGALVFWRTGWAGHVALSLGDGTVISTDYPHAGVMGRATLAQIDAWGPRLGWSAPDFP